MYYIGASTKSILVNFCPYFLLVLFYAFPLFFLILRASGIIDSTNRATKGLFRSPNRKFGNASKCLQTAFAFYCFAPGFCSEQ